MKKEHTSEGMNEARRCERRVESEKEAERVMLFVSTFFFYWLDGLDLCVGSGGGNARCICYLSSSIGFAIYIIFLLMIVWIQLISLILLLRRSLHIDILLRSI